MQVDGLGDLNKNFDTMTGKHTISELVASVKETANEVLEASKSNLTSGGQRVFDNLYKSGSVKRDSDSKADGDYYSIGYLAKYAYYVEFGRKKGKMPPVSAIYKWVVKKGLKEAGKAALSMAWGVAINISKRGSRAHPFLFPAFEEKKDNIYINMKKSFKNITKKLLR